MYCSNCGQKVDDNAVVCVNCGCAINKPANTKKEHGESKALLGVIAALFLGLIGLLIGVLAYPDNTIARKTFIKGWLITYIVEIVASIFLGIIVYVLAIGLLFV